MITLCVCARVVVWMEMSVTRDLRYDGNALYLDCINVNILVLILHNSFARCNHWGELGKGSILLLTIHAYLTCVFIITLRLKV